MTLGRSSRCDIQVPYRVVSSHHLTFQRAGKQFRLRDEDTTNGTEFDGEWLPSEEWVCVEDGSEIRIVDVVIDVSVDARDSGVEAFTLAETGTLARQMLGDALEEDDQERARFEAVGGPDRGADFSIPDHLESAAIGTAPDCLVALSGDELPAKLAELSFSEGKFRLCPTSETRIRLNDREIAERRPLFDGDRIALDAHELVFHDPLESRLLELEGLDSLGDEQTSPAEDDDANEDSSGGAPDNGPADRTSDGHGAADGPSNEGDSSEVGVEVGETPAETDSGQWGLVEMILLISTGLLLLLVVAILLVTFEVL